MYHVSKHYLLYEYSHHHHQREGYTSWGSKQDLQVYLWGWEAGLPVLQLVLGGAYEDMVLVTG